jgi:hypothetical protein
VILSRTCSYPYSYFVILTYTYIGAVKRRVFEGIMRHQNTFLCNLGQKGEQNLKLGVNIS